MSSLMQRVVNVVPESAKNTTVKLELSWGVIGMIIVLGTFYIAISSLGIDTFNKCSKIQDSQKWENLKSYLSHTMTMVIASIATLILVKMFKSQVVVFAMVFGIMGIIASSMTLAMTNECKDSVNKSARSFAIASLVLHLFMSVGIGLYKGFKWNKARKLAKVTKAGNAAAAARAAPVDPASEVMPMTASNMSAVGTGKQF